MKRSLKWFSSKTTSSPSNSPEPAGPSVGAGGNNSYRASPSSVSAAFRNPSPSDSTTDSPSSLLHPSSPSPSPTPQPLTPRDSVFPRSDLSPLTASKPIDIAVSHHRSTASISPADRNPITFPTHDLDDLDINWDQGPCLADLGFDPDVDMTAGQHFDSALSRSRQESFLGTGAKPISMANPNRDHVNRIRRESMAGSLRAGSLMAGSLMGNGMSWGGISVGSFIREDMMMTGTSPYLTHQSPSFHSSSYIPKLEANFMRDFTCCDRTWPTLHDLLQHYEENHHATAAPNTSNQNLNTFGTNQGNARGTASRATPTPAASRAQPGAQAMNGYQGQRHLSVAGAGMGLGGIGQMMRQQQVAPAVSKMSSMSHMNDDMDTVGEMELDETVGPMEMDDNQRTIQQTRQLFGQQQRSQLHLNSSGLPHQALRTSQPPTPAAVSFGFQNNPTVSSVNTPTLTTQGGLPQRGQFGQEDDNGDDMSGMPMKMNIGGVNLNGGQLGGLAGNLAFGALGTIDDPAKRLYSPGGTTQMTSQQRAFDAQMQMQQQLQQHLASMNLDLNQLAPGTDPALLLQQMTALMMPPTEEHKPFRCPVIGCEKAYKNQNGLKYHKTHGHSTQQLHENGDGTFSIVNPETSTPYPGTLGMEKEKPFKCDVCGKRYKNLNGLKYHKQHSPMCDPEMRAQHQNLISTMMSNPAALIAFQQNLPNINEDVML
ncbi:hypothetical protein GE21DRAFT_810 [Neurospora crassa]|uniref:C2H2 transcription factor n=2 Tax=Neurospora crassa TaxID=5141 RepID=Q7SFZ9_NEUCR|nr:C2H2 transcription factor [Neurospora crassa OR74A]EAA35788.1 C2H2 transcription factor [Neurospora crassa OR74A]KHE90061.1 hypothetical protein GE21DRAFT_810 [Neurospora crassa]CAE76443.1 related to zinc finger protein SFP1 [Neurospora crassa]|eukprot:XP_965024.1 C2H2 transcription factor [Neurospora crassa OR74A]